MSVAFIFQIDFEPAFNVSSYELLSILNIPVLICFLYIPFHSLEEYLFIC